MSKRLEFTLNNNSDVILGIDENYYNLGYGLGAIYGVPIISTLTHRQISGKESNLFKRLIIPSGELLSIKKENGLEENIEKVLKTFKNSPTSVKKFNLSFDIFGTYLHPPGSQIRYDFRLKNKNLELVRIGGMKDGLMFTDSPSEALIKLGSEELLDFSQKYIDFLYNERGMPKIQMIMRDVAKLFKNF